MLDRGQPVGVVGAKRIGRYVPSALWLVSLILLGVPYLGPVGWRLVFVLSSVPSYLDRLFDSYFWQVSWAMSGDLVAGSYEGSYTGYTQEGLLRLFTLIAALIAGCFVRVGSSLVLVLAGVLCVGCAWRACLSFDLSVEFGVAAFCLVLVTGSVVRRHREERVAFDDGIIAGG